MNSVPETADDTRGCSAEETTGMAAREVRQATFMLGVNAAKMQVLLQHRQQICQRRHEEPWLSFPCLDLGGRGGWLRGIWLRRLLSAQRPPCMTLVSCCRSWTAPSATAASCRPRELGLKFTPRHGAGHTFMPLNLSRLDYNRRSSFSFWHPLCAAACQTAWPSPGINFLEHADYVSPNPGSPKPNWNCAC